MSNWSGLTTVPLGDDGLSVKRLLRPFPSVAAAVMMSVLSLSAQSDSTDYAAPITVITATRDHDLADELPAAATTVDLRDIQRGEKLVSLDEALRHVPGVIASNRHNLSQGERLTVRGIGARAAFGVRGLKVLLDGIPLTTPDGQTQLGNVDLSAAGRIEVLRGPSSSLYGNAGGGVVAIHSAPGSAGAWHVRPGLIIGSDALWRSQIHIDGGNSKHRFSANVRRLQLDGFRHHSEAVVQGASIIGHHQLASTWQLVSVLNIYDAPYLLNPSSMSRQDAETRPRYSRGFVVAQGASKVARQIQGGVTLRHEARQRRTELTLYAVDRSLDNPIPGAIIDLNRASGGLRATHSHDHAVQGIPVRWQFGLDVEAQSDERTEFDNEGLSRTDVDAADVPDAVVRGALVLDQEERVRNVAPFTSIDIRPMPELLLTLGGRLDRYTLEADDALLADGDQSGTRTLSQLSPSLATSYRLGDLTWGYASIGTAFQTPTTTELSNRPDGSGGFNPNLDPESIVSLELGARGYWLPARLAWDVALYRMAVEDMLLPFQVDNPESEVIYFRNAGRAQSVGAEATLRTQATENVDLRLSATWLDFTFDDYVVVTDDGPLQLSGNELPGVPPAHIALSANIDLPRATWAEIETEWTDGYWANDFNGPPPGSTAVARDFFNDGYATVAVRLGGAVNLARYRAQLFAGVDNLLDKRYNGSVTPNAFGNRFFEPAAGRTWHAGITLE
ncbi:MAG TPA: TonB-dependent receptor [Candidatus Handelsmanbacteria bacterium]|nr:TonB-dependent receptor [Candidatus Handelsmanbacteria bacterium]